MEYKMVDHPSKEECIKAFKGGRTKLDIRKLTDEEIEEYWRIDELLCKNTMPFLPTTGEVKKLILLEKKMSL